jgi:hypothetical protein
MAASIFLGVIIARPGDPATAVDQEAKDSKLV